MDNSGIHIRFTNFFGFYGILSMKEVVAMRGESHRALGRFILDIYLPAAHPMQRKAFLLGCIEPDRNPISYCKGSIRAQWLRGHNYNNALRFMRRLINRLQRKTHWNLWDYYSLGKLIHYTADAFTYAHNKQFPDDLYQHHLYEVELQQQFLLFLNTPSCAFMELPDTGSELLPALHTAYINAEAGYETDIRFTMEACCRVADTLTKNRCA